MLTDNRHIRYNALYQENRPFLWLSFHMKARGHHCPFTGESQIKVGELGPTCHSIPTEAFCPGDRQSLIWSFPASLRYFCSFITYSFQARGATDKRPRHVHSIRRLCPAISPGPVHGTSRREKTCSLKSASHQSLYRLCLLPKRMSLQQSSASSFWSSHPQ